MRIVVQDKYYLRDLHREIDLYDRKLTHMLKHETFGTEALRDAAVRKLTAKRDQLAETARSLAASGVEFDANELPRSFRPADWTDPSRTDTEASAATTAEAMSTMSASAPGEVDEQSLMAAARTLRGYALREEESPLACALGSWQDDLAAYKKKRQKASAA